MQDKERGDEVSKEVIYEKGAQWRLSLPCFDRNTQLILDHCGGQDCGFIIHTAFNNCFV